MANKLFDAVIKLAPGKLKYKLKKIRLARSLMVSEKSYLVKTGYIHSMLNWSLKGQDGNYTPWMNYGIIAFFKKHLHSEIRVFEYGSGASTFFFAERCKSINSVEHDEDWYQQVGNDISNLENASLRLIALDDNYPKAIEDEHSEFDMVIVDGRKRVACAENALPFLSKSGVVILDDSNRDRYQSLFPFYEGHGFRHLTFEGLKPTALKNVTTTIFYRSDNCLNI